MKTCRQCGISKSSDCFYIERRVRHGAQKTYLHSYCKPCVGKRRKEWDLRNRPWSRERTRRYRLTTKGRQSHRNSCAKWYKTLSPEKREAFKAYQRELYQKKYKKRRLFGIKPDVDDRKAYLQKLSLTEA